MYENSFFCYNPKFCITFNLLDVFLQAAAHPGVEVNQFVMRLGGGKKHGRYWMADSVIDTASTPTLS
jgi:hypothetical protein